MPSWDAAGPSAPSIAPHRCWSVHLADLGRYDEAEEQLLMAYEGETQVRGPQHRSTREVVANLVRLYEARGQPEEAAQWRTRLPTTQPAPAPREGQP